MSKDNGGPAFPSSRDMRHNPDFDWESGMTLRDYFAAKAMQGILSKYGRPLDFMDLADDAYQIADAMLAERNK